MQLFTVAHFTVYTLQFVKIQKCKYVFSKIRVRCYLGYPGPCPDEGPSLGNSLVGGGRRGGASEEEDKVQSLSLRELLVHRDPLPLVYFALVQ